jgi:hypothetical protein
MKFSGHMVLFCGVGQALLYIPGGGVHQRHGFTQPEMQQTPAWVQVQGETIMGAGPNALQLRMHARH